MKHLLGTDPEWFLTKDGTTPVSAIGKFGGTKQKPKPLPKLGKGFAWQEDNVTVEYNIPPCDNVDKWLENNLSIQESITLHAKQLGLKPLIQASAVFPKEELLDPRAWIFGCEPDFNAWTLKPNPKPQSENIFLRSAGGHLHIAFDGNKMEKIELVRVLDVMVGIPCALADPDKQRQELYGKAGAFRYKPYGIEYRTPSNYWTKNVSWLKFIYAQIWDSVSYFKSKVRVPKDVQIALDTNQRDQMAHIYGGFALREMPK